MKPRCWRCRGFLTITTDGNGALLERCQKCAVYIAGLEDWIRALRQRHRRNQRRIYYRHRQKDNARSARWRANHPERVKAYSQEWRRQVKLGLRIPKRRKKP